MMIFTAGREQRQFLLVDIGVTDSVTAPCSARASSCRGRELSSIPQTNRDESKNEILQNLE